MTPRNLGTLVVLGAVAALPACSMFGGGSSSDSSGGQYHESTYIPPPSYSSPAASTAGAGTMASGETVAPVSPQLIREVQTALKQNGDYRGEVDGIWGPMTGSGVRRWQQARNLNATGEIDMATLQSMNISAGGRSSQASSANGGNNAVNNPNQPTNTAGNAAPPASSGPNYTTAGSHQSGSSYSANNPNPPANMPHPTNQGPNANNTNDNGNGSNR